MASDKRSQIDLSELLGTLLRDVVEADGMAAEATAEFITRVGLTPDGELRTVQFTYEQNTPSGLTKYVVSVPLLTIVPIPLLGVAEAELSFSATVVEMVDDDDDSPRLLAKVAPTSGGDQGAYEQSNITFKVKMARADMPAGISNIMALLGNSLHFTGK